jgi:hypothetical protein
MTFEKNVFINCPFDEEYTALLRPLLFTVLFLKLTPRIALEKLNSGQPRIEKILRLIRQSKFGIHDLSRIRARKRGEWFRLNMPLEIGADLACRTFGERKLKRKEFVILCAENYRYQAALSDLSGSDVLVHKNDPEQVVVIVRQWLRAQARISSAAGASFIWMSFNDFMAHMHEKLKRQGHSPKDIQSLSVPEVVSEMRLWLRRHSA